MSNKRTEDLAVYRIKKAKNDLETAKGAFTLKFLKIPSIALIIQSSMLPELYWHLKISTLKNTPV